jgi:eukaryotic-like serine/threonine-protein kinase
MVRCPSCSQPVQRGLRACLRCGAPLNDAEATLVSPAGSASGVSPPGAVSNPSLDAGRFVPGTILAGRFRIVDLLGRGGMGEVYRAEDLKLGQIVALKFIPESLEHEAPRLQRLLDEVRLALRVTHHNVCRVHDVGEVDGRHFISMEYVDGDDLSSLLRRVGRLSQDRAIAVARQLCAGLAAVHEQGILHRDLKPGNVLIDGRGRVKITDFGLAALQGDLLGMRGGTPAYMAPEQWADGQVTVRSDLYALGLVLYEMFTGKPAFAGATPAEFAQSHRDSAPTSPSSFISDLDPAVERVILRCLEKDPDDRPASALAVAAALPGGDPLAAALAAGELPSPELVARAGVEGGLRAPVLAALVAALVAGVTAVMLLNDETHLVRMAWLDKPPQVLAERARETLHSLGYTETPADHLEAFQPNQEYLQHVLKDEPFAARRTLLHRPQPSALQFWYRTSPQFLERTHKALIGGWMTDPPLLLPGMTRLALDPQGRLFAFAAVPPEVDSVAVHGNRADGEPDWRAAFIAAGLDATAFTAVEPAWNPPVFADRKAAWTGVYPESPETAIRIEAAAYHGRLVSFRIVEPWTRAVDAPEPPQGALARASHVVNVAWYVIVVVAAAFVAWRHVRLGRGDRRGALRLALYLGAVRLVWIIGQHHMPTSPEVDVVIANLAWASYRVCFVWIFYLAIEPYARRLWPRMMVSWVRLLGGRFRDPLVGRDILFGLGIGTAMELVALLSHWAVGRFGLAVPGFAWDVWSLESLRGIRGSLVALAGVHAQTLLEFFTGIMLLLVVRLLLRRTWAAVLVVSALATLMHNPQEGSFLVHAVSIVWVLILFWIAIFRVGLLAAMVAGTTLELLDTLPLTTDVSSWYFPATVITLGVGLALVIFTCRASLAGRPFVAGQTVPAGAVSRN